MREHGFKAWDSQEGEWITDAVAICSDGTIMVDLEGKEWIDPADPDRVIICFTTGLKDSNGVEVFEGDILAHRFKGATRRIIVWGESESKTGYFLNRVNGDTVIDAGRVVVESMKVIGNRYQHPTLLAEGAEE